MRRFDNLDDLMSAVGSPLPPSQWQRPDAGDAARFADLTGDRQWFHTPTLCGTAITRPAPDERPIFQAAYLLGLSVGMLAEVYAFPWTRRTLQRGYDDIRFPASAPLGSGLRIIATPSSVTPAGRHGHFLDTTVVMECDEAERPVLRGRFIALLETTGPTLEMTDATATTSPSTNLDEG